jgi:hypothetical protein
MDAPIHRKAICWALRALGGSAKVDEIQAEIVGRAPGSGPHPLVDLETLQRILAQGNGRLWTRILPGTYQITEAGLESISGITSGVRPG